MHDDIVDVAYNYIASVFIFDAIAVLPWYAMAPKYTFLRLLNLRKMMQY